MLDLSENEFEILECLKGELNTFRRDALRAVDVFDAKINREVFGNHIARIDGQIELINSFLGEKNV